MSDEDRLYRRKLFDQIAVEAMKAFLQRGDALEYIRQTRGNGMAMAALIAGTSFEMARQMMKHREQFRLAMEGEDDEEEGA